MNEVDNQSQINKVTTPEEAVLAFTGEQFVEWAQEHIRHEIKSWAGTTTLTTISTKPEKIKKFLLQVFLLNQAFLGSGSGDPGLLGFAIANLSESDDPEAETALEILEKIQIDLSLAEKISDETSIPDHESWQYLLISLGATKTEIERAKLKEAVRNYTSELSDLFSNSRWQMAIGAFAGFEWATLETYKLFADLLKRNTTLNDKDLAVLITPSLAEKQAIDIGRILDKAVVDSEDKQLVWAGLSRQLAAHQEFINSLVKYLD